MDLEGGPPKRFATRQGADMKAMCTLLAIAAVGCASGCQTSPGSDPLEAQAITVGTRRAQFEFNCLAANGALMSRTAVQPTAQRPAETEFTIEAVGCAQHATYIVVCPGDGRDCVITASRLVM